MTQYQGNVQSYVLEIQSPNSPYDQKAVISLHGAFGLAILYFVPQDGQLGKNQKRAGHDIFDVYYWMDSWPQFTDLLCNEKPVQFQYDDSNNTAQIRSVRATAPGGSKRFADRFIKAHLLSRQDRKKKYITSHALPCAVPFEFVINLKTAKAFGITVPQSAQSRADEVIEQVPDVRFWHKADNSVPPAFVRYWSNSGQVRAQAAGRPDGAMHE